MVKMHDARATYRMHRCRCAHAAVFFPQAVNDIPNGPTLLATALTEQDHGNWRKAVEDELAASGMLGELAWGVGALRGTSTSEEIVSTGGTAMHPRVTFRANPLGTPPRNLEQAKQIRHARSRNP